MLPSPPGNAPITVLALGMDPRKQALLRMAFRLHHSLRYQLQEDAPDSTPDLAIVDVDGQAGWLAWEDFRRLHPSLPALIATATPAADSPAPALRKPIQVETLFPLLRAALDAAPPAALPRAKPEPPLPAARAASPAPRPVPPRPAPAAPPAAAEPITIERFDPDRGLLGMARRLRQRRQAAIIGIDAAPLLVLLPLANQALQLADDAALQAACQADEQRLYLHPLTPGETLPDLPPRPLAPLIWQLAIWSSRGRLLRGIRADTPLRLRHWPNLTRLPPVPDAIRISALLGKTPVNLKLIARLLRVPPAHLFTYLAAAHSLDLLEWQSAASLPVMSSAPVRGARPPAAPPPSPPPPRQTAETGGLLSRLLRKVTGL